MVVRRRSSDEASALTGVPASHVVVGKPVTGKVGVVVDAQEVMVTVNEPILDDAREQPEERVPPVSDSQADRDSAAETIDKASSGWSWFGFGSADNVEKPEENKADKKTTSQKEQDANKAADKESSKVNADSKKEDSKTNETPASQGSFWGSLCSFTESIPSPLPAEPVKDEDDESQASSKLFGDLKSLPSARGDVTLSPNVPGDELGGNGDNSANPTANVASIVESKVKNMKQPEAMPISSRKNKKKGSDAEKSDNSDTEEKTDETLEARRQLLVKELRQAITSFGRYDIRCANISAALGDLLEESGEYEQAVRLHKGATTIFSCKLGDDHTTTMNAKIRLGNVLESAEEYDEAIHTYYGVMVMRQALKGEKDPTAADGHVYMARALRKKGDHPQAIKELKRALKVYRESLGDAHEKVATTVDEIASLYVTIGDFEKSAAILEEIVKLKAATLGMQNEAVAGTLCSLATTYECSEEFTKAMKSLKKAYKIYTEIGGYSSEEATATLNRIAQLYEATGDFNRASIAHLGVLRGRKINLGSDHLLVGQAYYRLGFSLRKTGQLEKALKCMKEALPIFVGKGVEMNDVEMIAEIMHEMALINKEKKNYSDAARIFKQELSVRRKIGQPEYPLIARALNEIGESEFELKNNGRALKYLVEALTIFQKRGEQGIDCAEVLYNTGLVFEAVRNKARALEAFEEAARIFEEHGLPESHPHVVSVNKKIDKLTRIDKIKEQRSDSSKETKEGSRKKRFFK